MSMNEARTFPPAVVRDAELAEAFAASVAAEERGVSGMKGIEKLCGLVEAAREWRAARGAAYEAHRADVARLERLWSSPDSLAAALAMAKAEASLLAVLADLDDGPGGVVTIKAGNAGDWSIFEPPP